MKTTDRPHCPRCNKRVEPVRIFEDRYWEGGAFFTFKGPRGNIRLAVCSECGITFDPAISEKLGCKCADCGHAIEDPPPMAWEFFHYITPSYRCEGCEEKKE